MDDMMSTDIVQQFITSALEGLPYPYSQPPGFADAETYVTFFEVQGSGRTASNVVTRIRHLIQLHAWTHSDTDEHRAAFFAALAKLRRAGVKVFSWGPDEYEKDTGLHHIACTLTWWERPNAMEQFEDTDGTDGAEDPSGTDEP